MGKEKAKSSRCRVPRGWARWGRVLSKAMDFSGEVSFSEATGSKLRPRQGEVQVRVKRKPDQQMPEAGTCYVFVCAYLSLPPSKDSRAAKQWSRPGNWRIGSY